MRNKPRIRFKGFTEDWEQRKLDDVFQIIDGDRGKNYPGIGDFLSNGDVLFLDTGNVRKDGFNFDNKRYIDFNRDKLLRNGRLILGDYVLTSRGTLGNLAYYSQSIYNRHPQIRINSAMLILRVMNTIKVNNLYLYITLRSNVINEFMKHNFVGSAQPHITKKEFSSVLLPIPRQLEEQKNIGDFFDKLEKIINLHQRKLEKLKLAKKALLQKLFPKNGSKFPELRFKGFADAWEQRKLGDIATITGGGTPSTNISEYWNGDIDWYSPVEIGEKRYASGSIRKITKLGLEKSSAKILPVGTVLFTSRAGIGNTAILQVEGCTNQGFQSITPNSKELDTYFLYTMTPKLKRYGEVTGAGSTFVEVSGKQMEQMNLMIPSLDEQKHVSQLFKVMDDAITLHQRKLDKLQEVKKGLLQKMFV